MKVFLALGLSFFVLFAIPLLPDVIVGYDIYNTLNFTVGHFNKSLFDFNIIIFSALAVIFLVTLILISKNIYCKYENKKSVSGFPIWGWISLLLFLISWVVAWTRIPLFSNIQSLTFAPLWISFIILLNAVIKKRTGQCPLLEEKKFFILLFLISSVFWWYFEFLNQFTGNWYYSLAPRNTGVFDMSILRILIISLSFSTVLPGIYSIYELLKTFVVEKRKSYHMSKTMIGILVIISFQSLFFIRFYPNELFWSLWMAPISLLLLTSFFIFKSQWPEDNLFIIYGSMASGLIAGFFWELWNSNSLSQWHYALPYVHAFKIFEMPVLGYMGYFPFGMESILISLILKRALESNHTSYFK